MPVGLSTALTTEERELIGRSIATFQLGEQSAGSHFLRAAYRFAQLNDMAPVARITELLIREERQHAALLRSFMDAHGIAAKQHDWTDSIFRRVRKLMELELYLAVLLTAELVGSVYYRALETVTGCQQLRLLCRMFVADELAHIGFESDLLLALRARRGPLARSSSNFAQRLFFLGTSMVVWMTHRPVLRRANYTMLTFLEACLLQYAFYLEPPQARASKSSAV
jgi:hypothetical protein